MIPVAASTRVRLRPLTPSDMEAVAPWYPQFPPGGQRLAIIPVPSGHEPIGVIVCEHDTPAPKWLTVRDICVAPGQRGWGYGSEAVRELEDTARKQGAERVLAEIDPTAGLALYFWLRLGFRPAGATEVFWRTQEPGGTIAMIKRL